MEFLKKHFGLIFVAAAAVIAALFALSYAMKRRRLALADAQKPTDDTDIEKLNLDKGEAAEALSALEAETKADEEAARLKAEIESAKSGETAPAEENGKEE